MRKKSHTVSVNAGAGAKQNYEPAMTIEHVKITMTQNGERQDEQKSTSDNP